MKDFGLVAPGESLSVLCLGAHCDDVEIGAGATILSWIDAGVRLHVQWCVLSAAGQRAEEARAGAAAFLEGAASARIEFAEFRDGFFPYQGAEIKDWVAAMSRRFTPDLVLTHRRGDGHQDHREVNRITWNVYRDHVILEYEIPKWDGDLGRPNMYMPVSARLLERKIRLLEGIYGTQRAKDWFDGETFRGLARLRGMECRAPERYAEAFTLRKGRLG
ncbi:PIG-L deacetylase family protein [Arenibaculum pallidiluteum]|uniref:PIG-L deacetylase family protein n=1 Tax=Arenibaculum pallidiluteum TaxID=2812559 RepID=UPI001A95CFEF|nr:PIG-L deacetylase family protein [Arenibaculum pallidiluteum]